jgi:hypothetical protein
LNRHPGEGRDLIVPVECTGEIPAFAGMTEHMRMALKVEQKLK